MLGSQTYNCLKNVSGQTKMSMWTFSVVCTLLLFVCCSAVSRAPIPNKINAKSEFYRIKSSNLLRLRGGGLLNWLDPRTPVSWPTYPKDVIPADGSVGGHYNLEEICGSARFIGKFMLFLSKNFIIYAAFQVKYLPFRHALQSSDTSYLPGIFDIICRSSYHSTLGHIK
jgi:hypothetical protein